MDVVKREEVARRIRAARETNGMRQADVALKTGLQQGLLSQWESGKIPEGACEVTAVGLCVGLRPDELYLEDVSSRARKDVGTLSNAESDSLGRIVSYLRRLRDMGVPFTETENFLAAFLRAPLNDTSESTPPPSAAMEVLEVQKLLDATLVDLPAESVLYGQIDTAAIRLKKLGAVLRTESKQGPRSTPAGASVVAQASEPLHAHRTKKKPRRT